MTLKRWYNEGLLGRRDGMWEFHTFKRSTRDKFISLVNEHRGLIVSIDEKPLLVIPSFEWQDGYVVIVDLPHTYTKYWR